jgi:hypothetical protein
MVAHGPVGRSAATAGAPRSRRGSPSSRRAAWRARSPGPGAPSRCGRAVARSRSASSRRPTATGSSSLRTRRARSPRPAQRRPRAAATGRAPPSPSRRAPARPRAWPRRRPSIGSTDRSTPTQVRTTNGTAISACPTGTSHHEARQSTGSVSKVISMPKPIVTAEVASGSISPPSSARPARPAATMARLASAPMTTANEVAQAAFVNEFAIASTGSIPMRIPGRISRRAEIGPCGRRPSRRRRERAHDERDQGSAGDHHGQAGDEGDEAAFAGVAGTTPHRCRQQADRPGMATLRHRRPRHDRDQRGELEDGQHGGTADVAELCRPPPHLDLDRAGAGCREDPDHAVRREREEEHDRGGGGHRRSYERQRDLGGDLPARRSQRGRRGLHVGRKVLPQRPDHAHDDRQVEHDVGADHRPHRAVERVGQQCEERSTHHHGRQHEHRGEQPDEHGATAEVETGEHVGGSEPDDDRHHGRHDRLPQR